VHNGQVSVNLATVQKLIAAQFPHFQHLHIERVPLLGTVSTIFRLGTELSIRFPLLGTAPEEVERTLQKEAEAMHEFAAFCPFETPTPLAIGKPAYGYPLPWTLHTWIAGDVGTPEGHASSSELVLDVIELIQSLRRAPVAGRPFSGAGRGGALKDHDAWVDMCLSKSGHLFDVRRLASLWAEFRQLSPPKDLGMCHKDLIPANLVIRQHRLVGILDAGGFGPADPSLDLVAAWHLFDEERREVMRVSLNATPEEWKRGAAWALEQSLGLGWYYEISNPDMSNLGVSTIRRILEASNRM